MNIPSEVHIRFVTDPRGIMHNVLEVCSKEHGVRFVKALDSETARERDKYKLRSHLQTERIAELEGENRKLKDGINAVDMLIEESKGIYGLHLNGYPSPWDELLEGGRYEEWLYDFSKALEDE